MNRTVENPTRLLMVNYDKRKCQEDEIALNFYDLDPELKKSSKFNLSENILNRKPRNHVIQVKNGLLNRDFILQTLKFDIRVRRFEERDGSIMVEFDTVDSSLSFYKQYINLVDMNFLADFGYDIFFSDWKISGYSSDLINGDFKPFVENIQKKDDRTHCISQGISMEELHSRIHYFNSLKSLYPEDKLQKANTKNNKIAEKGVVDKLLEDAMRNTDFIIENAKELAVGNTTNVPLQERFREMNEDEMCRFIDRLGNDISAISATKYGAYTIQALISACNTDKTRQLICKYFGENGKYLILHEVGNYSIQKILLFNPDYVFELIVSNLSLILGDFLGFKVLKRCIPALKNKKIQLKEKLEETSKNEKKVQEILNLIKMP